MNENLPNPKIPTRMLKSLKLKSGSSTWVLQILQTAFLFALKILPLL